jgi:hypothetical protein
MTQDVSILYQGGSGGFVLYYYLLLSGQFQHSIKETWQLIDQQFPTELAYNHRDWKKFEIWPDNRDLKTTTGRKLFLVCNPLWGDPDRNRDIPDNTYKIFLYTSLDLQLRLAWEKKAWWFSELVRKLHQAPINNRVYIRQIITEAATFNGQKVDPFVPKTVQYYNPEYIVKLEDFVKQKKLINEPTQDQLKFLDRWIGLQPKKALRLMDLSR